MKWIVPAIAALWHTLASADVYRWTDASGQVHFGDQAPQQEGELVLQEPPRIDAGANFDAKPVEGPLLSRVKGAWAGQRHGLSTSLVLEPGGVFVEAAMIQPKGYTPFFTRAYAGRWTLERNLLVFKVTFEDKAARRLPPPESAIVANAGNGRLELIWDRRQDPHVYTRTYGARPSAPEPLR
ncbi:DUF4124 domain-containing protein [Allohahella marinimesophila]|uniref:DUF4124 domain-containing protein n=1 Tax=Allohahella marinimesophila TaxID=1054972 RepID=A0ABP7Q2G7_9GAMM